MGDKVRKAIPSFPTNLSSIDWDVFGCGGLPKGKIIEFYGPESAGKTAFAMHIVGEIQRAGGVAALVDAEHAISPKFAAILGVNMDELLVSQPDCGEEALDIVEGLVKASAVDVIVVDSVAALVPRAELAGEMGDSHMGLQARLMSQACRKLTGICKKNGVTVIFINQIREKIGVMFGNPEVTTGGRALRFYSSIRVNITRVAESNKGLILDANKTLLGHRVYLRNSKNKCANPRRETVIDLLYASGFDKDEDAIDFALRLGIIEGSAWLTFKNDPLGTKFRRDDLDGLAVQKAINDYFIDLQAKSEAEYKKLEQSKKEDKSEKAADISEG